MNVCVDTSSDVFVSVVFTFFWMSSSDSLSLTYESIVESRLNAHKRRRYAVQDITPREPIVSSTDARDQSTTAADDGQRQLNVISVVNHSVPTIFLHRI
ncbi:unnamed protein product [Medioppia subpectinata]|uniref:Uncharacterized protein n=1 Tax=Medioppia subpectinata TaxID=1979941 RepID=A0A7R9Q672_9ACAR|nr:unnamed protein product [Medioppia subpectinata]CAG2114103.1 unnamed protein product [Medioppia subpectinata]